MLLKIFVEKDQYKNVFAHFRITIFIPLVLTLLIYMSVDFVISNFLNVCHTENCEVRDLSICSNRLDLKKKYMGMFDKKGG